MAGGGGRGGSPSKAQLEEQQRLAALARLRDDLAALDTAAAAADRAAAARKAADAIWPPPPPASRPSRAPKAQRQSWRDLRGTVQRLSEAEQQLTTTPQHSPRRSARPHSSLLPRPVPLRHMYLSTKVEAVAWPRNVCAAR